jgi:hypothetical protein
MKIIEVAQILGVIFSSGKRVMCSFWRKMVFVTFWAIFSQTQLVTLAPTAIV